MALRWESANGGNVPQHAVEGGRSGYNKEIMYVARAQMDGDLVPGKVVPSHKQGYFGCNGHEKPQTSYEVLTNHGANLVWVKAANGQIPPGAVAGGKVSSTGEALYVARGHPPEEPNGCHGGKLHASHGQAYIPYNGKEHAVKEYEVLCQQ